jgi:addiction module HigA family antidote
MKNPSHPGEIALYGILQPLDISVTRAAEILGVRRATLSDMINGNAALSAEMAYRLEKAFGVRAEMLLRVQNQYDLAQVRKKSKDIKVKRYRQAA